MILKDRPLLRLGIGFVLSVLAMFGLIVSQDWTYWDSWPGYLVVATWFGGHIMGGTS